MALPQQGTETGKHGQVRKVVVPVLMALPQQGTETYKDIERDIILILIVLMALPQQGTETAGLLNSH